jgi:hypothetical protein
MTLVRPMIGRQLFLVPIERSVTGGNHFVMCPTINPHGIEFRAVLPSARQSASWAAFRFRRF